MNISTNFYLNIKFICEEKKLLLRELEEKVGVSTGYLSRLAKGNKDIGLSKACRIAEMLSIPITDLIKPDLWKEYKIRALRIELEELTRKKNEQIY